MYKIADTIDDLLNDVFTELLNSPLRVSATRGDCSEVIGVLLQLNNPRSRLSISETKGKPFSALGELLWCLSGSNSLDFIIYYLKTYEENAEDDGSVYGAYGPRFFDWKGQNQVENVYNLLTNNPTSRKAVIQLYDAVDIAKPYKDIPCTCTLQFFVREGKLDMFTSMRSNDAYWGLPHDIFLFTMLQEIMARRLSVEVGKYSHAIGSLHLYDKKRGLAEQYLQEGWYSTTDIVMPSMPLGDPSEIIGELLIIEKRIRNGERIDISMLNFDSYWNDLIRLLQVYSYSKNKDVESANVILSEIENLPYRMYIKKRVKEMKIE